MRFRIRLWLIEAREALWRGIANALPHKLAYWTAVRVMAHATGPKFGNSHPDRTSVLIALQRWQ